MTSLPTDPDIADRVLLDLGREAFKHARELLRAARLVLDAEIWSVAYANAALALEEIGKGVMCTAILPLPDGKRQEEMEAFRARVTDHGAKSFCAQLVLGMAGEGAPDSVEELFKQADRNARRTNKNKFRGLYVDYKNTGHILRPSDITKTQATELIATAEKALAISEGAEDALSRPDLYMQLIRHVRAGAADGVWEVLTEEAGQVALAMPAVARDELSPQEALQGTAMAKLLEGLIPATAEEPTTL
ncbi:AbiV family abortive infection protein [Streptomyces sp. NPDC003038]|uniref:AbiV family abortive infection protein n=1 Tax=unclassified Streptomyces TaxID=2593676 RepID=UPI0033BF3441